LIVPYGPGGVTDVVARLVADEASKTLGQAIVVENKPGVNGTLGAMRMVNTEPDGYTLSVVPIGIFRLPHIQKTSYEPLRDLMFISMLAGYLYAIAVRNDAPWKNVADLVEHSRQKPNSISYGTPSTYSSQHLAMVELGRLANVEWTHIPFKGDAEATQNLLGGNVQVIVASNSVLPYVQNGQIRLLASLEEDKGIGPFGEFATLKSQGFDVAATSPLRYRWDEKHDAGNRREVGRCFQKGDRKPTFPRGGGAIWGSGAIPRSPALHRLRQANVGGRETLDAKRGAKHCASRSQEVMACTCAVSTRAGATGGHGLPVARFLLLRLTMLSDVKPIKYWPS
jgi:Tripartite tricarboxylate transporter family receptor